jgi:large subunit GTPase 1
MARVNETGGYQVQASLAEKQAARDLRSVTETSDLVEFMAAAETAERDFSAEREAKLVVDAGKGFVLDKVEASEEEKAKVQKLLRMPERPHWQPKDTPDDLDRREREAFIMWRRDLAMIEAAHPGVLLTPYEKNIEVWRQLWRVVERAEIVVQIVDARNPLLFLSSDLERYVKSLPQKREFMVLLNKADLIPDEIRQRWAAFFRGKGTRYAFWSASAAQAVIDEEGGVPELMEPEDIFADKMRKDAKAEALAAEQVIEKVLTRDELFDLFFQLRPQYEEGEEPGANKAPRWGEVTSVSGARPSAVVGLIGFPNVGKSSTLNVLIGQKRAQVSATPGKTKHFQTFRVDREVMICDCPGLVFPSVATTKADMVCNGILPIDQMRDFRGPMELVARRIKREVIEYVYGVVLPKPGFDEDPNRPPTGQEIGTAVAFMRGYMTSAVGNPNEALAARIILKDLVNGKLLYIVPPPGTGPVGPLPIEIEAREKVALRKNERPTYDLKPEVVGLDILKGALQGDQAVRAFTGRRGGKRGDNRNKAVFAGQRATPYSPVPIAQLREIKKASAAGAGPGSSASAPRAPAAGTAVPAAQARGGRSKEEEQEQEEEEDYEDDEGEDDEEDHNGWHGYDDGEQEDEETVRVVKK